MKNVNMKVQFVHREITNCKSRAQIRNKEQVFRKKWEYRLRKMQTNNE
jgi:hypothetical protein